jgi:hypothetical protein
MSDYHDPPSPSPSHPPPHHVLPSSSAFTGDLPENGTTSARQYENRARKNIRRRLSPRGRRGESPERQSPPAPTYRRTPGANRVGEENPVVEKAAADQEEGHIGDLYGQLWFVPNSSPNPQRARVSTSGKGGGQLFWIRKELVSQRRIRLEDCLPVGRSDRFDAELRRLSFAKDIWAGGDKATFVEALKKAPMADGGRWVWQPDRPPRAAGRPQLNSQRGRGGHQPQGQRAPPPTLPTLRHRNSRINTRAERKSQQVNHRSISISIRSQQCRTRSKRKP